MGQRVDIVLRLIVKFRAVESLGRIVVAGDKVAFDSSRATFSTTAAVSALFLPFATTSRKYLPERRTGRGVFAAPTRLIVKVSLGN